MQHLEIRDLVFLLCWIEKHPTQVKGKQSEDLTRVKKVVGNIHTCQSDFDIREGYRADHFERHLTAHIGQLIDQIQPV